CGYLSNWFIDIPASLPSPHRFDCRRCMGMEIDSATIKCPVCGWSLDVVDGVLQPEQLEIQEEFQKEPVDIRPAALKIDKFLALQPGEIILNFLTAPDSLTDKWGSENVERLQVELSEEMLAENRAKSCAEARGTVHYLRGPLDLAFLRPESMDAIIVEIQTDHIENHRNEIQILLKLLRLSGKAVLVLSDIDGNSKMKDNLLGKVKSEFRDSFGDLSVKLVHVRQLNMLFIEHPKPESGIIMPPRRKDRGVKRVHRNHDAG
ncbi:MAG: hypothetical protein NTY09_14865, partial [bacterium]|nr:hypothetical protein [bacterium]